MNGIGERIRIARRAAKLTQAQLGARCGMADSAIRRYESGRGNPTVETLQRIADALDIPAGELIDTTPQPDREFENMCGILNHAGLSIEAAGWSDGTGPDGDYFYIWHDDAASPEEDRITKSYRDILRAVDDALRTAEIHKADYIRQRLDLELF